MKSQKTWKPLLVLLILFLLGMGIFILADHQIIF